MSIPELGVGPEALLQRAEHLRDHGKSKRIKQIGEDVCEHLRKATSDSLFDKLEMISYRVNGRLVDVYTWAGVELIAAEALTGEEPVPECKLFSDEDLAKIGARRVMPGLIPSSDVGVQPLSGHFDLNAPTFSSKRNKLILKQN